MSRFQLGLPGRVRPSADDPGARNAVTDVRALLTPAEITAVRVDACNAACAFLARFGCFRRAGLDALAELCIDEPIIGNVYASGERLDHAALKALRLSPAIVVGEAFARHVRPDCGPEAIAAIRLLFASLQKRFPCLMLRRLGERLRAGGGFAYSRLAADHEHSCMAAWKLDGECFVLAETPLLPLAECDRTDCACSLVAQLGPDTP